MTVQGLVPSNPQTAPEYRRLRLFAGQTSTHEARTGGDKARRDGRAGMKVVIQRVRIIRWLYTERSICTDPWTATLR